MSNRKPAQLVTTLTLTALAASIPTATALAQTRAPSVSTGAATAVGYGSAELGGALNPHGATTTYYFQYGPTRAYGLQTAPASAGPTTVAVGVSAPVTGLAPATRYHYRLVALNGGGARTGADRSLKTSAIPLSLQILGAPNPTLYGSAAVIEGTLLGTGNADRAVVLQENPFPYTQGFLDAGEPHLTTATGGFAFPVLGLTQATQFRVVTPGSPQIASPVVIEQVAPIVTIHARHTRRRHRVRIYGTVTPNEEGMSVEILRLGRAGMHRVASTFARRLTATSARYSKVVRVRRSGVYEVLVRVTNGAQTPTTSAPIRIR